jgi:hypothetical protein
MGAKRKVSPGQSPAKKGKQSVADLHHNDELVAVLGELGKAEQALGQRFKAVAYFRAANTLKALDYVHSLSTWILSLVESLQWKRSSSAPWDWEICEIAKVVCSFELH